MDIRYYHDFVGDDNVLNRFELLTQNAEAIQVEASPQPFVLEYVEAKKLEPVRGSQATIELICNKIFQFVDLHTDDMQKYLVKFYRSDSLYWLGWLDAELYNEQLSDVPPYKVSFTASDFNILERLKYLDNSEKQFSDIVPLITHLKRCFDKLALPFNKLYIGCSTSANDITVTSAETALHVLHVMSSNFYDEDNEPMTCREVVESILQPFGLMMVQKGANVYIYDYNTVKLGLPMKRYDFSTFNYEADETVNFNLGNLADIGFMSTDSSYGFEEMANNVTITSSLYAGDTQLDVDINEDSVSDFYIPEEPHVTNVDFYKSAKNVERLNSNGKYVIYYERNLASYIGEKESIAGCYMDYIPNNTSFAGIQYRIRYPNYIYKIEIPEGRRKSPYYINLKVSAYPSTVSHPLLQDAKEVANSGVLKAFCNLYYMDGNGTIIAYYNNSGENTYGWIPVPDSNVPVGKCILWFSTDDTDNSILDTWTTNANKVRPMDQPTDHALALDASLVGKGLFVMPEISGYLVFELTDKNLILNPVSGEEVESDSIKMILFNDISLEIVDTEGKSPSTDDYEFKSYVNKKVASDFDDVTLKCISANEEKAPIGKANILKKIDNHYELQLSYTRNGQTEILERLLMRTIHSNYTTKNEKISVEVKMTENPALNFVSYEPILSDKYLVTGCTLDFHSGKTTLSAVGYSADVANLSSIPYD